MALDLRSGYVEAVIGVTALGPAARLEAGYHPFNRLSAFGFGQWSQAGGAMAGVGACLTFDL